MFNSLNMNNLPLTSVDIGDFTGNNADHTLTSSIKCYFNLIKVRGTLELAAGLQWISLTKASMIIV